MIKGTQDTNLLELQSGGRPRGAESRQAYPARGRHLLRGDGSSAPRGVPVLGDGEHQGRRGSELQGGGPGADQPGSSQDHLVRWPGGQAVPRLGYPLLQRRGRPNDPRLVQVQPGTDAYGLEQKHPDTGYRRARFLEPDAPGQRQLHLPGRELPGER